ncbi:MAG: hypothetical protein OHK0046_26470 [Anaerolineae bacterium]
MRRLFMLLVLLLLALVMQPPNALAQDPVPTLVPPTLVPQPETGSEELLPSESTVARIQRNGVVRVGLLYNEPPFGELNVRGSHTGFDADLARSMAEVWGVEVEFVQVTRQLENTLHMLRTGEVDMLMAALIHRRELDPFMDFSQTYVNSQKSMMVRADDPVASLAEMANRRIGVVIASPAQNALSLWMARTAVPLSVQTYLTLDRAYVALAQGEVDGVVDSQHRLQQVSAQRPELTRLLNEPVEREPYAIGLLRQDASMRNLVNRTLQYLMVNGRLDEIQQVYFPGTSANAVQVWDNLGEDAPTPAQFPVEFLLPAQRIVPRLQTNPVVRVAGLIGVTADGQSTESERRLDTFHRALLSEMAARWGASVEFLPGNTTTNALELVASGQADVAVGVALDWVWADRVDFTGLYLLHGERLLVRANDEITSFIDLRGGGTVITPANEPTAAPRAVEIAELPNVNARIDIEQRPEVDLAFSLLVDEELEADAVFGDSLKLIPHAQAEPELLRLVDFEDGTPRWYSRSNLNPDDFAPRPMVLAVPANDIDFRLLVEYTLQEMARDGSLQRLLQPVMMPDEIPQFEIWPGPSSYLNFTLTAR